MINLFSRESVCFNLLNLAAGVIGHDPEDTAAEGTLLCETVYYADGTRAGVTTPDDGYWTTRYIGSLIYEGEPGQETLEGIVTDVSCIFMQVDPMAEKYYGMSPYAYCHNNSINRFDFEGKWDIKVSAFSDRAKCPYAILTAYTRNGIAFFNTVVKIKDTSRNRLVTNADTPTGKYKIIGWRKTGSGTNYNTDSYGKMTCLHWNTFQEKRIVLVGQVCIFTEVAQAQKS